MGLARSQPSVWAKQPIHETAQRRSGFAAGSRIFESDEDMTDAFLAKASRRSSTNPSPITGAKVTLRWRDGTSDHTLGLAEIILIVGAATSAVSIDQCRLAASTCTNTPLSIIDWGRWDVP